MDNKEKEFDPSNYLSFLKEIGYLVNDGPDFKIETKNVDLEISTIAGPQLVVPVMNARYALNAANARWGSFYDALYGTDIISEKDGAERQAKFNPVRAKKVINYSRNFLDEHIPLLEGSWKNITETPKVFDGILNLKLKNQKQFVGYSKNVNGLCSILLKNNNLHIDIIIDPNGSNGRNDKAGIQDIILESVSGLFK